MTRANPSFQLDGDRMSTTETPRNLLPLTLPSLLSIPRYTTEACLLIRATRSAVGDPVRRVGGSAIDPALEQTPNGTASEYVHPRRRPHGTATTRVIGTMITTSRLGLARRTGGRRRMSSLQSLAVETGPTRASIGRARRRRPRGWTSMPCRDGLRRGRR